MLVLSCTLWAVLKLAAPFLNLIPAAALIAYLGTAESVRKGYLPIIGLVLYVGIGSVMFYSIKAAQAAEIVTVDSSCSQR